MIVPGSKVTIQTGQNKYQIIVKHIVLNDNFEPLVHVKYYNPETKSKGEMTLDYSTIKTMRILSE